MKIDWTETVLNKLMFDEGSYSWREDIVISNNLNLDEVTFWTASEFATRALKPYTTTWCEQQLGEAELDEALKMSKTDKDSVIMDLGCGDGRFVHYFLKQGYTKIVALNYELEPLLALRDTLSDQDKSKVLIICGDIFKHPLKKESADFILAWGLFTSTSDFRESMSECTKILKPKSYLFNAEPTLEHAVVYSLVMNDANELYNTLTTKTRARMWDEKEFRYRVQSLSELRSYMSGSDLELLWERGINVLPSLLFGGVLTNQEADDAFKEQLWQAIKNSDTGWYRQMTYFSRKRA